MSLKSRLATIGLVTGLVATALTGCGEAKDTKETVEATNEVESTVPEEPTVEESIVESVEESVEEPVVEEKVCTANDILDLCDTLSKKYSEALTSDQVLSLLIVANYDYIPADELAALFDSIELSADDVKNLFDDTMRQFLDAQKNMLACRNAAANADYDAFDLYYYNPVKSSDFMVINEYKEETDYLDAFWTNPDYKLTTTASNFFEKKLLSNSSLGNSLNYVLDF